MKNLLSGKAEKDFTLWYDNYSEENHGLKGWLDHDQYLDKVELPHSLMNALIIEWLDTVGIYTDAHLLPHFDESEIVSVCWYVNIATSYGCYNSDDNYPSRKEAIEHAISEANMIYNLIKED